MPKSYVTPTLADIHEMMSDLHDARVIDKKTMREFDESCLTPIVDMTPRRSSNFASANKPARQSSPDTLTSLSAWSANGSAARSTPTALP
jgi:hypothetical protein